MDAARRTEILNAYGRVLENRPCSVGRMRDLPFDGGLIRQAILATLFSNHDPQFQEHLKVSLMELESFVSDEEFEVVRKYEAWLTETCARGKTEGLAAIGDSVTTHDALDADKYAEILQRVNEKEHEVISCLRRLHSSTESV
jgi:hypothetical protein